MLLFYHSRMFYNHFIATLYDFLGLTYWPSAHYQLFFCLFFTSQEINIKRSPNTAKLAGDFLWTRTPKMGQSSTWGCPEGAQPTRARLEAHARPGGLCPPWWPPAPLPRPINSQIFQNPSGSWRNRIPATASSRTTRSNLDTITEGFIILIGASPMMRE